MTEKEKILNFIGWMGAIFLGACLLAGLILSLTVAVHALDAGPQAEARRAYYQACKRQFKAGIFQEPCVTAVRDRLGP